MRRDVIDLLRSNCFSPGVSSVYFLFVLSFLACSYELIHSSLSLSLSPRPFGCRVLCCVVESKTAQLASIGHFPAQKKKKLETQL